VPTVGLSPRTVAYIHTILHRAFKDAVRWGRLARGEALGLRWSDVDLDTGRVRIVQTVIQIRGNVTIGEPKTDRGRRAFTLDDGTIAALRAHRREMNEQRLLVGADFTDRDLLFRLPSGQPLHPDAVSATFERQVRRYGLPRLTLHGLRHTWATLALESGVHPRVVQERLGHSTIAITLGIYSHVSPTLDSDAARTVAALVLPQ
jgi:integrase